MIRKFLFLVLGFACLGSVLLSSCRREKFSDSCALEFSTDTLTFDTVFSTLGSATRSFKIYNRCKESVRISRISLAGLQGAQFRLNIDGIAGREFRDIEIPAQDSIYAFAEVSVNPAQGNLPFIIEDEVIFETNGQVQKVALNAWGQNAYFHYGEVISGNVIWSSDLPHVVVSKDTVPGVYVKPGARLSIQPGTQVFMGPGAAILVSGDLQVNAGSWSDSVVFQGVRLEPFYKDKPGQWLGLFFLRESTSGGTGSLKYTIIDEATYGISVGSGFESDIAFFQNTANRPSVTANRIIVRNSQASALFGFNGQFTGENCLFYAAGDYLVSLGLGGKYNFGNCTFFNRGSSYISHQKPALLLSNFAVANNTIYPAPLDQAYFDNCVVYGSLEKEVAFGKQDGIAFGSRFRYCLLKAVEDTVAFYQENALPLTACKFNTDPKFKRPETGNFMPDSVASPLLDASGFGAGADLYDRIRPVVVSNPASPYDIGAIEFDSP
jgi:hypothetical protein